MFLDGKRGLKLCRVAWVDMGKLCYVASDLDQLSLFVLCNGVFGCVGRIVCFACGIGMRQILLASALVCIWESVWELTKKLNNESEQVVNSFSVADVRIVFQIQRHVDGSVALRRNVYRTWCEFPRGYL